MTAKKKEKRFIIWSNMDLDPDDWKDAYAESIRDTGLPFEPDGGGLLDFIKETNYSYLEDERANLDIRLGQPIIVIGGPGFRHGRGTGYKMIDSGNISDCLYDSNGRTEWYVDGYGNLRADSCRHAVTEHYLYRLIKDGATDEQIGLLRDALCSGKPAGGYISRFTRRLGDEVCRAYGWDCPGRKHIKEAV